ncbi:MAG TPA: hypothetical protein VNP73_07460 [Actinomycetota bacterium]|nr:hypothetical protein [Actinomycetota bacterium]
MGEEEELEQESRRPKVVDKRISAGGHAPPAKPSPEPVAAEGPAPGDEPPQAPERFESPSGGTPPPPGGAEQVWTPEQEAEAKRIVEEIVRTPSLDWVLNVAVNLANVAGTKLEMGAAQDAQLAIDALASLINGLGDRLQDAEAPLKQTLAQLQLAYAQRAGAPADK